MIKQASEKADRTLQILAQYFRVYPFKESPRRVLMFTKLIEMGGKKNGIQTIVVYNLQRPHTAPRTVQEWQMLIWRIIPCFKKKKLTE